MGLQEEEMISSQALDQYLFSTVGNNSLLHFCYPVLILNVL